MSFRNYMRWEGWVAIVVGVGLCTLGVVQGHEGAGDALFGGAILLAGTGGFMAYRHRVPLRAPGAWFTSTPLAGASAEREACARRRVLGWLVAETAAGAAFVVAASVLTGYWLTYMDFGVWAVAVGAIKVGPAAAAIAAHEARAGTTYRVARRRLRGLVELSG